MKRVKWNLFLSFLIGLLVVSATAKPTMADLQCLADAQLSCPGGYTEMFQIQSTDNAHVSIDGTYSYNICCRDDSGISISPSCATAVNDIMFRISGNNNAHAEKNTQSNYGIDICVGSDDALDVECSYATTSCPADYGCVAKISDETNAHLSDCNAPNGYDLICCNVESDVGAPTTTINPDGQIWTNSDVGFALTCTDNNPPCQATYYEIINDGASCNPAGSPAYSSGTSGTVTCPAGSACERRVCMYSVDSSGNSETPHPSNVFQIDKENPSTSESHSPTPPNGWYISDVTVDLTCSDGSGSGCTGGLAQTLYCTTSSSCNPNVIGTPFTISSEGTNYFRYRSIDRVGNQEPVQGPVTIRIDTIAPTTTATPSGTSGSGGWYISDVAVDLSCDDGPGDVSGCAPSETWYCVDQSDTCTPTNVYSGQFSVTNEGTSYIRFMSSDVARNVEPEQSISVQIDKIDPTAWNYPLPEWTNETPGLGAFFDVTWDGSDGTGSGIAAFDIQYRIEERTGVVVQDWNNWLTGQPNPGTQTFGPVNPVVVSNNNNRTFLFRVRARDVAGHQAPFSAAPYSNTTIDVVSPTCSIDDPGAFQTNPAFDITIHATEGESGMDKFECQIRGPTGTWRDISMNCDTPYENVYSDTITCTLNDGTYDFRCKGTDIAKNTGDWSPIVTTTVDTQPPMVQINEPTYVWTNADQFTLTWQGSADVVSYDVYYYETAWPGGPPANPSLWVPWRSGDSSYTSDTFGGGDPNLGEGMTYYINVTATDGAGNLDWDMVNVSIDRTPPAIDITVTDQDGVEIEEEWIPPGSGITFVNITSKTYDSLSGVKNNTIIYVVSGGTMPGTYFLECVEGPSPRYSNCSTGLDNPEGVDHIEYGDTTSIRYKVETRDRAGNLNETRFYFTVAHPLANFASSSYYIILGETKLVPVLVRNIQESPDDITLNLTSSNYQFAWFDYLCEPNECILGSDKKDMDVLNVNPYEERTYYVRLLSSEPGEYALHLNATSALDITLEDNHTLSLEMGYPVYFPGLGTWSIILLLILSGLIYSWVSRKDF